MSLHNALIKSLSFSLIFVCATCLSVHPHIEKIYSLVNPNLLTGTQDEQTNSTLFYGRDDGETLLPNGKLYRVLNSILEERRGKWNTPVGSSTAQNSRLHYLDIEQNDSDDDKRRRGSNVLHKQSLPRPDGTSVSTKQNNALLLARKIVVTFGAVMTLIVLMMTLIAKVALLLLLMPIAKVMAKMPNKRNMPKKTLLVLATLLTVVATIAMLALLTLVAFAKLLV